MYATIVIGTNRKPNPTTCAMRRHTAAEKLICKSIRFVE